MNTDKKKLEDGVILGNNYSSRGSVRIYDL